jgi:DNA-binding MarR family transcriptional regulator
MKTNIELQSRVGYAIKRVFHAERTAIDNALRDLSMTAAQWGVLMTLHKHDGLTNADLARLRECTPQSMNAIIMHLEQTGLVERHPHPTHGTVLPARLTPAGEDLLARCADRVEVIEERMLSDLDAQERRILLGLLHRCASALQCDLTT